VIRATVLVAGRTGWTRTGFSVCSMTVGSKGHGGRGRDPDLGFFSVPGGRVLHLVEPVIIGGRMPPTPADGEGFVREGDLRPPGTTHGDECDGGVILRWKVRAAG